MPEAGRRSSVVALDDAVAVVEDGMTVGIGGAVTAGHPMALVRALARRGVRDLTVVAPTAGLEVELLIAAGCVSRVMGSYVGHEVLAGVGPVFRAAVQAGTVEMVDLDEAHCAVGLRAAGQRLPFYPWRGGVGTSYPQLNPALVEFEDPVRGEPLLAVPAIELDVALIYAEECDAYGNAQPVGTGHMDYLMGYAANAVVVQTDRIASTEEIRRHPERTYFWPGATVVLAPFGTHPYSNARLVADEEHLRAWLAAAKEGEEGLAAYLRTHVHEPADHVGYLETIGIRRLTELLV
jgi:glutaconate CoA-transferase subunit A